METLATAGDDASVVTALFLCGLLAVAGGVIALTNVCVQLKLVFVGRSLSRETAEAMEETDNGSSSESEADELSPAEIAAQERVSARLRALDEEDEVLLWRRKKPEDAR